MDCCCCYCCPHCCCCCCCCCCSCCCCCCCYTSAIVVKSFNYVINYLACFSCMVVCWLSRQGNFAYRPSVVGWTFLMSCTVLIDKLSCRCSLSVFAVWCCRCKARSDADDQQLVFVCMSLVCVLTDSEWHELLFYVAQAHGRQDGNTVSAARTESAVN